MSGRPAWCTVSHPREELLLAFSKHFKLWGTDFLDEGLCEKAVAVANDFEKDVRLQLILPGVVIEELRPPEILLLNPTRTQPDATAATSKFT